MNNNNICKYTLQYVKSETDTCSFVTLDDIAKKIQNGHILLFQHNQILVGKIENGIINNWLSGEKPDVDIRSYQKIYAINVDCEINLRSRGGKLIGRIREDAEINENEQQGFAPFYDTRMPLRPVIGKLLRASESEKYMIVTRNYIGFNEATGQAGIVDSRMIYFDKLLNY